MLDRIKRYCNIIAPSGYERAVREVIIEDIKDFADSYSVDGMGNLVAFKKGRKRAEHKTLLSAHMDEVGMIVKYITDDGRIYFSNVGGIDRRVMAGKRVKVGYKAITGVIASKSIHIQSAAEKGKCEDPQNMFIDIGALTRSEVEAIVKPGEPICFAPNYSTFGDGLARSKAIDDRFGCAVLVDILRSELEYDTYFAFCVSEECGCDGATVVCRRENPERVIVIEATTAGDVVGAPAHRLACLLRCGAVISHMDNGTIYPRATVDLAMSLAAEKGIPAQLKNIVAGGNEAKAYQTSGSGAVVLAISCPTRYIHSPACVAAICDMNAVRDLAAALIERSF